MSMYTFAINFISEENPTFCLRTRSPLSPATHEHSAHSPSRQVSQAAGTGPPPRQACVSMRPRTEQILKLCTVCKQHLPKKAPGDTKEPWRERLGWPPFSSWSCRNACHHSTQGCHLQGDLQGQWESHLWLPRARVLPALPQAGDQPRWSTHTTGSHPKGSSALESKLTHRLSTAAHTILIST